MQDRIEKYWPRSMDPSHWEAIADFVRAAVRAADPASPYSAGVMLSTLSVFVEWAWMEGQALEFDTVFDRWNIERFIARGCPGTWNKATRGNNRSILFRAAEGLLGREASTHRVRPIGGSDPLAPYTDEEIVTFRGWAKSQTGVEWRRSATALLAVGLGGGLTNQDIGVLRSHHVSLLDDGTVVADVPEPHPRRVVILAEWEEELISALAGLDPNEYVVRRYRSRPSRNLVTGLIAETNGAIKPEGQRLRATWITTHLRMGTPIDLLMHAAGVTTMRSFTRYLPFIPPVPTHVAIGHLRWGRRP